MPIIHYPGYIAKEEAARRKQVQVRTVNIWLRKHAVPSLKADRFVFIKDETSHTPPPPNIAISTLEWVTTFARRHKIISERIYEQIILGNVTGVVIADRVFVIPTEPSLLSFTSAVSK